MRLHVNYAKITSKRFLAYSGSTYRIRLRFYTTVSIIILFVTSRFAFVVVCNYEKCCFTQATELYEDRILSGIQPTGCLHIGNYFGAVRNWVNLQNSGQRVICAIADLHSMTLPYVRSSSFLFTRETRFSDTRMYYVDKCAGMFVLQFSGRSSVNR